MRGVGGEKTVGKKREAKRSRGMGEARMSRRMRQEQGRNQGIEGKNGESIGEWLGGSGEDRKRGGRRREKEDYGGEGQETGIGKRKDKEGEIGVEIQEAQLSESERQAGRLYDIVRTDRMGYKSVMAQFEQMDHEERK